MEKRRSLTILSDENIPLVESVFEHLGEVRTCAGREMSAEAVQDVDVLLVRSVTPVDEALLAESPVRFVGSATIGIDHVDLSYLQQNGIAFAHAPGSNAESVVEYVLAALLRLAARRGRAIEDMTVGIVGCGNVGGRLASRLPAFGASVLRNDPPLAEEAPDPEAFVSLATVLEKADVISLHVPLTTSGPYATHHLVDRDFLSATSPDVWLLNTSRGAVVDNKCLKHHLAKEDSGTVVLDVWENEPTPDPQLMHRVDLATPHIAGYSFDGKVTGTFMLYQALTRYLGAEPVWSLKQLLSSVEEDDFILCAPKDAASKEEWLDVLVRQMYDIAADDARLRKIVELPEGRRADYFAELRKHYPQRRSFRRFKLAASSVPEPYRKVVTEGLGVQLA